MLDSLHVGRKLAAAALVGGLVVGTMGNALPVAAHHGAEGSGSAAATGAALAGSQLVTLTGAVTQSSCTDSLWGNLLLSMAYQRDDMIQKYAKRLNRVNTLTLLSIAGVSGLGLAQSITSYANTSQGQTYNVVEHHGSDAHIHTKADSRLPATLGIVGSGATLGTLGAKAVLDHRYKKRLEKRQEVIKNKIDRILTQLESGEPSEDTHAELVALVGERATGEFMQIWQATHP